MSRTPEQIYAVYEMMFKEAAQIRDFQIAQGEKVSGTVNMLLKGDRSKFLKRWADEMEEVAGVLDGSHDDPYTLESTQVFYWASLYAVSGGVSWSELDFEGAARMDSVSYGLDAPGLLASQSKRVAEVDVESVPARKLFAFWWAAHSIYRKTTPEDQQFTIAQLMAYEWHQFTQRSYLSPILKKIDATASA